VLILPRIRRLASGESGSALLLMPAAVLVLFFLAGIAVDAAVQFLGQRRVADLAASVAQDAVASVDVESFYDQERELVIDPGGAAARQQTLLTNLPSDDAFLSPSCEVAIAGVTATAECRAQVRLIFRGMLPGASVIRDVQAVETAEGQQSGG
jgi:Flp pilus assembly protein TadG